MAKNTLLIFIGLIHFIEYIQSLPIQPNFDMTLDNEFINLGEIDTGYEEPSVYIFKRMVNQVAEQMNGMIVNEHSYKTPNTVVQQTTMIVDGKPHVMGSYSVTDDNGLTIMTVYKADEKGFRPVTKVSFKNRKDIRSLLGGK